MKNIDNKIVIYTAPDKSIRMEIEVDKETIWLTQKQIVDLFQTTQSVISRHIKNIFGSGELNPKSNMQKMHNAFSDKPIVEYSLDTVISVGYRVNSKKATQFRIWATKTLGKYLVSGYAIDKKRLMEQEQKLLDIQQTISLIREKSKFEILSGHEKDLLDIVSEYTRSLVLLNKFDKNNLQIGRVNKYIKYQLSYGDYQKLLDSVKKSYRKIEKIGSLFGSEIGDKIKGIIGSINQTFDGNDLYSSIEEKAANLLYFVIKDHPFSDGNKRIGSMLFIYFLNKNQYLFRDSGEKKINDNAMVALALLIAVSNPAEKDNIIKLVVNLIK